jgi:dTDP-4-dehydrorhamnose reductase
MHILLLGGSGYVGTAFQDLFKSRGIPYRSVSRAESAGYDPSQLIRLIRETGTTFLVNAAGYTGKPNVDACETHKAECLDGNAVLPGRVRQACETAGIPWGHISSGCIFTGRRQDGGGFHEDDAPNFSFRTNNCSFYSGTKALGEEVLAGADQCYLWRLRIPFDHLDSPRNYLSKLLTYARLLEAENSISHLGDFVSSCLACHEKQVPFGTYNLTNPGAVTTHEVASLLRDRIAPNKKFDFFSDESEFMRLAAKTPRSNCVMDTTKSEAAGVAMRPIAEALAEALTRWTPAQPR